MTQVARERPQTSAVLAGNLLAWLPLAAVVVALTRTVDPLSVFPVYFAIGAAFVALATVLIERPLIERFAVRFTPPGWALALTIGGFGLAIPGAAVSGLVSLLAADGWGAGAYMIIGAIIFGLAGAWCALVGWLLLGLTRRSRILAWAVVGASAALVVAAAVLAAVRWWS
ncbi:MAG: hypothetical protein ACSLE8_09600 [Rhodococcus sp. (in: high G+C Gram-positive bacteria)]